MLNFWSVQQVLPQNQNESYIYGMLAFPLLELARMDDAEKAARKGLDINKQDLWSQHCVSQIRFDSWKPFGWVLSLILFAVDHLNLTFSTSVWDFALTFLSFILNLIFSTSVWNFVLTLWNVDKNLSFFIDSYHFFLVGSFLFPEFWWMILICNCCFWPRLLAIGKKS